MKVVGIGDIVEPSSPLIRSDQVIKLWRHVYDYVVTDSNTERKFVTELDTREDVIVCAKIQKAFTIPTPVGNNNPDWTISFKEGSVKHIYFFAETKGSFSSLQLRGIENSKIACARKLFEKTTCDEVKYEVIMDHSALMQLVK